MIKTFKQFNEALNAKQLGVLNTFLGRLKGYQFTTTQQLDAVAGFMFGEPTKGEEIESENGQKAVRYINSDKSADIIMFYDEKGGKNVVTDVINHSDSTAVTESLNSNVNIPSFMSKQQYEHLVGLLQQTADHYIEFDNDSKRPVALYKSYGDTSDAYINSFELEDDGSIKISLGGHEGAEVSVVLGDDFIMFDADEIISKIEEVHQDFV